MKVLRQLYGLLVLVCGLAHAHTGSSSFVMLEQRPGGAVHAQIDIALRDLNQLTPLDANADGDITWGEVLRAEAQIESAAFARTHLMNDGKPCAIAAREPLAIAQHGDGPYVRVSARFACGRIGELMVDHSGWIALDATHRGLLEYVDASGHTAQAILSASQPQWHAAASRWERVVAFLQQGIVHLVTGYDHLAFLSVLLLALMRRRDVSEPVDWHASVRGALSVITAFTAAHSLTLGLAATGYLTLPTQPVEVAIALSVLCAALLNLHRRTAGHGWQLAFALGLIHGLGFAGALAELAGDRIDWLALAAFNVGIEVAQIAIAAVLLPLLWCLLRSTRNERVGVPLLSSAIAGMAAVWVMARVVG